MVCGQITFLMEATMLHTQNGYIRLTSTMILIQFLLYALHFDRLRGLKAWLRFSRARTEIPWARPVWFCGMRNYRRTGFNCVV